MNALYRRLDQIDGGGDGRKPGTDLLSGLRPRRQITGSTPWLPLRCPGSRPTALRAAGVGIGLVFSHEWGGAHWQRRSKSSSTHQGSPARVCGGQRCRIDAQDIADLLGGFLPARGRGIGVLVGQQPADLLGVPAVRASALRRRQLPQSQSDHPQVVFARLGSSTWEGAYDARTAGCRLASIERRCG